MDPIRQLTELGQSLWLDFIHRDLLDSGELAAMVRDGGIRGVTSNPSIFLKALSGSSYDGAIAALLRDDPDLPTKALYEALAVADIRDACEVLHPVWEASGGDDGYVSLEVSPALAHDTEGTVAEALRLHASVDRPNLMIKVPGTEAGVPAFEELTARGISVNVTLLFAVERYEDVARAWIRGLERCDDPTRPASVASFFVSRIDSKVDARLPDMPEKARAAVAGRVAVANARLAYRSFKRIFNGPEFAALRGRGARVQRPLWASTSTKNPAYSDVLYVEQLIGPDTVNTVPPATWEAFRDHGTAAHTVDRDPSGDDAVLFALAEARVSLPSITAALETEGVASFSAAFDDLLRALDDRRG